MEISRDAVSKKLDTIPEPDRENYLQALKSKGYTWKSNSAGDVVAQPQQSTGRQIANASFGALPLAGMVAGGALATPFAAASGPFAPFVEGAGMAIGGMGGQGINKAYQYLSGQGQDQTPGGNAQDLRQTGQNALEASLIGPIAGKAITAVGNGIGNAAVRFGKQFAGIPETVGRYVQGRGVGNVLTHENMAPGSTENALETAQSFLSNLRSRAGANVGAAEDAILASGEAGKMFDTTQMAKSLRDNLERSGITGTTETLSGWGGHHPPPGIAMLKNAQALLDKGQLTGKELINVKRLLSDAVDYSGGRLPEIGSLAQGLIKGVAQNARIATNTAYQGLGEANANASQAFDLYDKYRKFLGQQDNGPEVKATGDALRRIRSAFNSQPAIATEMSGDIGAQNAQPLFDTIAAQHYTANSPVLISPSSPLLKIASTVGLTGPQIAGVALKASEAVGNAIKFGGAFPVASVLANYYKSPGAR